MVLEAPSIKAKLTVTGEPLPANYILPDVPVENIQQPSLAAGLTDALGAAGLIQSKTLIGSNLGLVATVNKKIVVKAPDWFYVLQVHPVAEGVIRRSYTPNTEGANVAIVMEFLSESEGGELSVRVTPPYGQLHFYEQILQVPTYVTDDPYEGIFRGALFAGWTVCFTFSQRAGAYLDSITGTRYGDLVGGTVGTNHELAALVG